MFFSGRQIGAVQSLTLPDCTWSPKGRTVMADAATLYDTYARAPMRFERGEGVWLITEGGERYLDFAAGVAVNSLGHGHPHLVAALKEQADKGPNSSNFLADSSKLRC